MIMQVNAKTTIASVNFDKTLYASPLMVMTEQDYTKHYFIEGERVCSKIGSGFGSAEFMPTTNHLQFITGDPSTIREELKYLFHRHINCTYYDGHWSIYDRLDPAHNESSNFEENQYFYHPDHLGSSSFITDFWGRAEQHIQYAPFGELIVSQRNSEFDSRYKFTAKEHDTETDYTYTSTSSVRRFGARYYDSDASIWLSVDPLASERSWVSPYSYCQNNPMNRVDPTGALDNPIYDYIGKFLGTDNKGLKGEPILMGEFNFTQGMSHEEATQKGTLYHNLDAEAKELFKQGGGEKHYLSLNTRPDWDGFVTIDEGVQWAKDHPGALNNITPDNTLYLDASKLNFGSMKSSDLAEGQIVSINIFDYTNFSSNSSRHTSYALGNTRMKLLNGTTGQVQLFSDNYDWDYHQAGYVHSNTSPPNSTRDRLVWGDRILKGLNDSHGFRVNIYGVGTLNK